MIETMAEAFDGLAIARRRITEEAEAGSGFLDLRRSVYLASPGAVWLRHLPSLTSEPASSARIAPSHRLTELWMKTQ